MAHLNGLACLRIKRTSTSQKCGVNFLISCTVCIVCVLSGIALHAGQNDDDADERSGWPRTDQLYYYGRPYTTILRVEARKTITHALGRTCVSISHTARPLLRHG